MRHGKEIMNYDGNIKWQFDHLKLFVCLIVDEIVFKIWVEKKILTFETKSLTKMKCEWKSMIRSVKIYEKNKILD